MGEGNGNDAAGNEVMALRARTEAEQDAYMQGELSALALAERKGVKYARWVIEASQEMIYEERKR